MNSNCENEIKINYDFIMKILQENIGNIIDEFIVLNMNNRINKYIADSLTRWIVESFKKSEIEIKSEIDKIIK